jgi:hypothetical protein
MSKNNGDDIDHTTTKKFLHALTKNILNSDKSIRWVGLTDQDGNIISEQNREGVKLLLTKEETQESAINTIIRHKTRTKFEPKMGELRYAIGRYEKLSRSIIPIDNEENYYLILTMDFDQYDFDKIITEKIIPLIKQEKEKFKQG